MEKLSKNIEAIGVRSRPYDDWRISLSELKFYSIPVIEYARLSRSHHETWPLFRINASIFPGQTDQDHKPTEAELNAAFRTYKNSLIDFNFVASLFQSFPFYLALMNRPITYFLVQQFPRHVPKQDSPKPPFIHTAKSFVEEVIRQQWRLKEDLAFADHPVGNPSKAYSAWHRKAMGPSALMADVDYIEMRNENPVAVIEVTKANSDDLSYGLFAFLTRSFAQASVMILIAEELSVDAYAVTYSDALSHVARLRLHRDLIPKIDGIDRARQQLARQKTDEGANWSKAQGWAVRTLWDREGKELMESLAADLHSSTLSDYQKWLEGLPNPPSAGRAQASPAKPGRAQTPG